MLLAKTILVAAAVAGAALASPQAATNERTTPEGPTLRHVVRELVGAGAPGALAVVRTPTEVTRAAAGVGRRHPKVALTATDRFRIASLTKTFVATVVLQLVAEGKLRLDDTVERWLPRLVPNGEEITIRELLDHTSGLFDYTDDRTFVRAVIAHPGRSWRPRTLVGIAASHPPVHPPGSGWSYSNTNYIVLGLVVEAATGRSLGAELERRLFDPLELRQTSFTPALEPAGRALAHGYIGFATLPRLASLRDVTAVLSLSFAWAAGGVVSNGDDVTRFYAALLGGRLLPARLLHTMETSAPGSRYGLGLLIVDTPCGRAYGHTGDTPGYRSVAYATPNGSRVAVVMVNVDDTYVGQSQLETAAASALCSG